MRANMMRVTTANHSNAPHTNPSLNPEEAKPTRWIVDILPAKSDKPIKGHFKFLPAKKKPSLVSDFLRI